MIERLHPEMRASARLLSLADRRREIKHVATPAIFGEAKTSESVGGMIMPTWITKVVVHRLADNHLFGLLPSVRNLKPGAFILGVDWSRRSHGMRLGLACSDGARVIHLGDGTGYQELIYRLLVDGAISAAKRYRPLRVSICNEYAVCV